MFTFIRSRASFENHIRLLKSRTVFLVYSVSPKRQKKISYLLDQQIIYIAYIGEEIGWFMS